MRRYAGGAPYQTEAVSRVLRADERFHSAIEGVESWHCFSAGAHYDPDNTAHGRLIGFDVHLVAPGAGFDWHAHRGVAIVSWVQAGTLRHEDDSGAVLDVPAGAVLAQHTGDGIRHRETNGGTTPLTLVQMSLLDDTASGVDVGAAPITIGAARFEVWPSGAAATAARWHCFVASGAWQVDESAIAAGDSVRGSAHLAAQGTGALLVWLLP